MLEDEQDAVPSEIFFSMSEKEDFDGTRVPVDDRDMASGDIFSE